MIHVVDTHALLWYLEGSNRLSGPARGVLATSLDPLVVPAIVLGEARYAIDRKRTTVTWDELLGAIEGDHRFHVHPLDLDILRRLPVGLEMHDAIICATAAAYQEASGEAVPLISKDRRIRDSGLAQTAW